MSPRSMIWNSSDNTVGSDCFTVRITQTGKFAAIVLKRSTLPFAQPAPQPSFFTVKQGEPVTGLIGAQSALVEPVPANCPVVSPTILNEELLVKTKAHRSCIAPLLVTAIGYSASL